MKIASDEDAHDQQSISIVKRYCSTYREQLAALDEAELVAALAELMVSQNSKVFTGEAGLAQFLEGKLGQCVKDGIRETIAELGGRSALFPSSKAGA